MVLWELLTGETPYRDVDRAAIIYGVGTNSLKLPLPPSLPNGFLLLMRMCCDPKPRNRPSFSSILLHLSIASTDLVSQDPESYAAQQQIWKREVRSQLNQTLSPSIHNSNSTDSSDRPNQMQQRRRNDSSSYNNNHFYNMNNNGRGDSDRGAPDELRRIAEMKRVEDIRGCTKRS